MIDSGYSPSNIKQGYVLRKILREIYYNNGKMDHVYFNQEIERPIKPALEEMYDGANDLDIEKIGNKYGINLRFIYWMLHK